MEKRKMSAPVANLIPVSWLYIRSLVTVVTELFYLGYYKFHSSVLTECQVNRLKQMVQIVTGVVQLSHCFAFSLYRHSKLCVTLILVMRVVWTLLCKS